MKFYSVFTKQGKIDIPIKDKDVPAAEAIAKDPILDVVEKVRELSDLSNKLTKAQADALGNRVEKISFKDVDGRVVTIEKGGPGSGCQGPNCGRPAGSGSGAGARPSTPRLDAQHGMGRSEAFGLHEKLSAPFNPPNKVAPVPYAVASQGGKSYVVHLPTNTSVNPAIADIKQGSTVRFARPEKGEENLHYEVLEHNGDRLLVRPTGDHPDAKLPIQPTQTLPLHEFVPSEYDERTPAQRHESKLRTTQESLDQGDSLHTMDQADKYNKARAAGMKHEDALRHAGANPKDLVRPVSTGKIPREGGGKPIRVSTPSKEDDAAAEGAAPKLDLKGKSDKTVLTLHQALAQEVKTREAEGKPLKPHEVRTMNELKAELKSRNIHPETSYFDYEKHPSSEEQTRPAKKPPVPDAPINPRKSLDAIRDAAGAAQRLAKGGPGSGCQGPNCGRPAGSGAGGGEHVGFKLSPSQRENLKDMKPGSQAANEYNALSDDGKRDYHSARTEGMGHEEAHRFAETSQNSGGGWMMDARGAKTTGGKDELKDYEELTPDQKKTYLTHRQGLKKPALSHDDALAQAKIPTKTGVTTPGKFSISQADHGKYLGKLPSGNYDVVDEEETGGRSYPWGTFSNTKVRHESGKEFSIPTGNAQLIGLLPKYRGPRKSIDGLRDLAGRVAKGGPGSGCQGPNCGRPKGSGSGSGKPFNAENFVGGPEYYSPSADKRVKENGKPFKYAEYKDWSDEDIVNEYNDVAPHVGKDDDKEFNRTKEELQYRGIIKVPTAYRDLSNKEVKEHFNNAKEERAIHSVDDLSQSPFDTAHEYFHGKEELKRRGLLKKDN